jgi:tetratricopeptide (TPR) repeat protein
MSEYYKTDDGKVFDSKWRAESHAEDLARQEKLDREAAEAAAKFAKWANGVVDQAFGIMSEGDYQGALDFFEKNISDWNDIPAQFAYPMGWAYEMLNNYERAIHFYSESIKIYRHYEGFSTSVSRTFIARARVHLKTGDWNSAKFDCERIMDNEYLDINIRREILGIAFYYRGICFENLGNIKRAVTDYKLSSDYGKHDSLTKLNDLGVNYSPKKPPKTLLGSRFLAFFYGLFYVVFLSITAVLLFFYFPVLTSGVLPI